MTVWYHQESDRLGVLCLHGLIMSNDFPPEDDWLDDSNDVRHLVDKIRPGFEKSLENFGHGLIKKGWSVIGGFGPTCSLWESYMICEGWQNKKPKNQSTGVFYNPNTDKLILSLRSRRRSLLVEGFKYIGEFEE